MTMVLFSQETTQPISWDAKGCNKESSCTGGEKHTSTISHHLCVRSPWILSSCTKVPQQRSPKTGSGQARPCSRAQWCLPAMQWDWGVRLLTGLMAFWWHSVHLLGRAAVTQASLAFSVFLLLSPPLSSAGTLPLAGPNQRLSRSQCQTILLPEPWAKENSFISNNPVPGVLF